MIFYTTAKSLKSDFRSRSAKNRFLGKTEPEATRWQRGNRALFRKLLGMETFKPFAPKGKKIHSMLAGGILREEWLVRTEADVTMPVTILRPVSRGPHPTVLALHGHGMGGRMGTSGRRDLPIMKAALDQYRCDYGLRLAQAGIVAVCPDARGFGARREGSKQDESADPKRFLQSSCSAIQLASVPLGYTLQGMWAWDLMALIDFMERDPGMDLSNLGCIGLSGGGLQTLNLAALDPRVRHAVVSGYFYGVRESLQEMHENCMCNMVPHLWEHFDMGDIAGLIAPRSLFIETGDEDPLNGRSGVSNVKGQVSVAKKVFDAFGASSQLKHHVFHGNHRFEGTRSLPWILKGLSGG